MTDKELLRTLWHLQGRAQGLVEEVRALRRAVEHRIADQVRVESGLPLLEEGELRALDDAVGGPAFEVVKQEDPVDELRRTGLEAAKCVAGEAVVDLEREKVLFAEAMQATAGRAWAAAMAGGGLAGALFLDAAGRGGEPRGGCASTKEDTANVAAATVSSEVDAPAEPLELPERGVSGSP